MLSMAGVENIFPMRVPCPWKKSNKGKQAEDDWSQI